MNIFGKKVFLRAIEEEDLSTFHKWSNDPQTQDIIGNINLPSSFEFHKNWFKQIQNDNLNLRFAIDTHDYGVIGISTIIKIDWKNRHAWHGIMLGDKDLRGKGYGKDAVMATMRYAFDEMNLQRLEGSMIEYNKTSISFYCEKLGWKKEGVRRNYFFRKGQFWDQILVGITRDDYKELVVKNNYWNE